MRPHGIDAAGRLQYRYHPKWTEVREALKTRRLAGIAKSLPDIERAVREVRAQGLLVVSLNMAGSVPDAADLVVTDPVQAGVMAVMAVAETASFTLDRLSRRVF